jgi:hypothetical protein
LYCISKKKNITNNSQSMKKNKEGARNKFLRMTLQWHIKTLLHREASRPQDTNPKRLALYLLV